MLNKQKITNNLSRTFKKSIHPAIWRRMTPMARNRHKAKQAAYKQHRRKNKVILLLSKYPRGHSTPYRKTKIPNTSNSRIVSYVTAQVKKNVKTAARLHKKTQSAREVYTWSNLLHTQGFKVAQKNKKLLKFIVYRPLALLESWRKDSIDSHTWAASAEKVTAATSSKLMRWDYSLPTFYLSSRAADCFIIESSDFIYAVNKITTSRLDKTIYGSLLILSEGLNFNSKDLFREYEVATADVTDSPSTRRATLKENAVINLYKLLLEQPVASGPVINSNIIKNKKLKSDIEKRGQIKHIVRMRYRWFFQPKLSKFKLFKKFFKRVFKRYRKINKNKLFVSKFRSHFPKLTGFTEKGLLKMWVPFRRNYNQYWATSNAVLRFSQSLLLAPVSLLVFLQLSPSFAASKHIIKSGAVSINGLAVTAFTQFKPGDIMQLNFVIWKSVRHFFDYQRWNNDFRALQYVPFLQADWSSLMFMVIRWPRKHELVAPSFLSERWIRYYIRQFPSKISNFRKADGNWKIYKRIIAKR